MGRQIDPRERYLLRNDSEEAVFRAHFGPQIDKCRDTYLQWFLGQFRPYAWRSIIISPENQEFVIGLLCILQIEGRIQFSIRFPGPGIVELQREEPGEL